MVLLWGRNYMVFFCKFAALFEFAVGPKLGVLLERFDIKKTDIKFSCHVSFIHVCTVNVRTMSSGCVQRPQNRKRHS
jgi:hypothetical protein